MQCLNVAGTMTECPLRRGVNLWEVKNAVFVCGWDHDRVSAYERLKLQCLYVAGSMTECPLRRGVPYEKLNSICMWLGP